MPNDVHELMIQLPCNISTLETKIRAFCEQNGCFDTAVATVTSRQAIDSWNDVFYIKVIALKKENAQ